MNWSDPNRPNDWSVIAHGEKATVSIKHNGGLSSQHLPVAKGADGKAYVPPANPNITATITPSTSNTSNTDSTTPSSPTTFDMKNIDSWCNKNWDTNGVNNWTEAMWDKWMDKYYKGWRNWTQARWDQYDKDMAKMMAGLL